MYRHSVTPFGAFEKHTFENGKGNSFSIVPNYGALLTALNIDNQSLTEGYATYNEMLPLAWGKSILLAPYPNRLRDGRYSLNGNTYQFDLTNPDTGNSIHGFLMKCPFEVKSTFSTLDEAAITCAYHHDGSHPSYPFRFSCEVTYQLKGAEFTVDLSFKNNDETEIPVGLGWHPYFTLSDNADDVFLQMPDCQIVESDERMLPTGKKTTFDHFKSLERVNGFKFDNTFFINQTTGCTEILLQSDAGKLTYWQDVDNGKWQFVQVFIPPARRSIAIEPMTCNVDAFNNNDGLVMLKTGEILRGSFGVKFEK